MSTPVQTEHLVGDLRPALVGCLERLGGVPEKLVFDNDASVVASGTDSRARLHDELARLLGALQTKPVVLRPARPTAKGSAERTIGCAETSFLPLRPFADLADLQGQHDAWATDIAYRRHIRRLGGTVAEWFAAERGFLAPLPVPRPDTGLLLEARAGKDAFVRREGALSCSVFGRRFLLSFQPALTTPLGREHGHVPVVQQAARRRASIATAREDDARGIKCGPSAKGTSGRSGCGRLQMTRAARGPTTRHGRSDAWRARGPIGTTGSRRAERRRHRGA